jgi:hypothetical protein
VEDGPAALVYRASKLSRGAAWVVLACAAGVSVAAITNAGGTPTGSILLSAVFVLAAWALLRLEVRATAEELVVCGGRTTRRFPWGDVRGFELNPMTNREIFVLVKGNARHLLPIASVASRKVPAEPVRAELERFWKAHRR